MVNGKRCSLQPDSEVSSSREWQGHTNYLDLDPLVPFMLRQGCCDLYTLFARIKTKAGVHWGPAAVNTKALLCLQHRLLHFLRLHKKYSEPTLSLQSVNTLYQTFMGFSSYSKASLFSKIQAIRRLCFWICNMQPSAGNWSGRYLVTRRWEYLMELNWRCLAFSESL